MRFDLHPLNHPPIPQLARLSSSCLASMATSLLLAAPLCFRRHGSTPFHQQPDEAAVEVSDEEESTFDEAAAEPEGCNLLPLKRIIFSYHLTLMLAYRCLVKEDDREAPSFLIESVEKDSEDTKNVGRDSVVGAQPPAMEVVAKAKHVTVMDHDMKSVMEQFSPDQMKIPRAIVEQWNPQIVDGLPDAFSDLVKHQAHIETGRVVKDNKRLKLSGQDDSDNSATDAWNC